MDIWLIIYLVIHVFKDQVLDTNTVDFGWSIYLRSIPLHAAEPEHRVRERNSTIVTDRWLEVCHVYRRGLWRSFQFCIRVY